MAIYESFDYWLQQLPIFAIALGVIYFLTPRWSRSQSECSEHPVQAVPDRSDLEQQSQAIADTGKKPKGPRLLYIDHLRTVLTCVVIVFHCTCVFIGQGGPCGFNIWGAERLSENWKEDKQTFHNNSLKRYFGAWFTASNNAYFMALFFFVSGFFTPSSFDRKGVYDFLKDKFKRYGIPVVFAFFVMMPGLMFFTIKVILPSDLTWGSQGTWIIGSPVWFVSILLGFNVLYAFIDGDPAKISAPNVGTLLGVGLILGIQIDLFDGASLFLNVPMGWKFFPEYILFFYAGAAAKRNDWLKSLAERPKATVMMMRILALVLLVLEWLALALPDGPPDNLHINVLVGIKAMVYSFVLLELFGTFLNHDLGCLMKRLSEAAYTAYIIHPVVMSLVMWSWACIMRSCVEHTVMTHMAPLEDLTGPTYQTGKSYPAFQGVAGIGFLVVSSHFQELQWLGWVYTNVLTTLIVWPLAYGIRQLPYFDQVL